jgi:hypothetical protein
MGSKGPKTSTTQNTYPPWLQAALQPLIQGATQNMGTFMNQGFNVLQGRPAGDGAMPSSRPGRGGGHGRMDLRELLQNVSAAPTRGRQ